MLEERITLQTTLELCTGGCKDFTKYFTWTASKENVKTCGMCLTYVKYNNFFNNCIKVGTNDFP